MVSIALAVTAARDPYETCGHLGLTAAIWDKPSLRRLREIDEIYALRDMGRVALSPRHGLPHERHTVGTGIARLGLPVHIRSLVLNHSPMNRGITDAVYNRYAYDKEKCEALMAWETQVHAAATATKPACLFTGYAPSEAHHRP